MTRIFKAKTRQGYVIKVLAELLQNNIKTACFEVDSEGIRLCMMDHHRTILINLELDADNFTVYKYTKNEKMNLGVNLTHFHKMLKSIKKRDSIQLFINDDSPTDLGIKVIPKENNRTTTSYVKIQGIQTLRVEIPEGYNKPIIVPSGEYQKMCKGMAHIGSTVKIGAREFQIRFTCDAGGVMKRVTDFGEPDDSDSDEEEAKGEAEDYKEDFQTEQLTRITKLAGLSTNMQIYPKQGLPLLFRSNVGDLGKISIYIKSRDQIARESQPIDSEDDEDF
jgi:proliferating cell nuclear antigen PCNA